MSQHHNATVHDAVGPDLPLVQAAAALTMGVVSLLLVGVLPDLLGALADEHRLSAESIGLTGGCEGLAMGLSTAAAAIVLPSRYLKFIGAGATLALAALDFSTVHAAGTAVVIIRTLAGLPEGVLLWITTSMIARTQTPERWAGIFFTVLCAAQMLAALVFAQWVLPDFGADGGFAALALAGLIGVPAAFFLPSRMAPLMKDETLSGTPPPRGWFALFATLVYIGATSTVGVYLQPLAHQAGLSADVARTAVWVSLAAQIAGGVASTVMAGHVRWLTVFVGCSFAFLVNWVVMLLHVPGWAFIAANALGGFVSILIAAFIVPMTIEADPSRRAAVLGGSTQVLAGALGPLAASLVVADNDVHGAILLGAVSLLAGLGLIAGLHFTARKVQSA